jgi:hypothetical protein
MVFNAHYAWEMKIARFGAYPGVTLSSRCLAVSLLLSILLMCEPTVGAWKRRAAADSDADMTQLRHNATFKRGLLGCLFVGFSNKTKQNEMKPEGHRNWQLELI